MSDPAGDFRAYSSWRWSLEPGHDLVGDFLLPALVRARRYDRQAGFFSSSCLLVSAKGIEHLLRRVPRSGWPAYRLIVCERLDEGDVEAILAGHRVRRLEERLTPRMLRALEEPADAAARDRLALLAAMVAVGFAEIRVALPCTAEGLPRPGAIEHAKVAILYDWAGNTLVGFGSANESWQGWVHNNEQMDLYASWDEPAWSRYGQPKVERFDRLWEGREPLALTVDLPRAVRERLVAMAPDALPAELVQPLEPGSDPLSAQQEAVVLQFLRDAPHLRGGCFVAMTTAAVTPWPHHVGTVATAVAADPPRFLLCDEVGLGKTVEAGFIIRQLRLQGRGARVLVLAPRALCEQWQDELVSKFSLPAALYDGAERVEPDLGDGRGRARRPVGRKEVFAAPDLVLIASTELMRRQDRRGDLLQAPAWDLVVVDEAHHARRTGFDRDDREPNQLLALVQQLAGRTRGLLLLTATPMQVDPREVWDLLRVLGLSGPLGQSYGHFQRFYWRLAELREGRVDRAGLDDLFDTIRAGVQADPSLLKPVEEQDFALYRRCMAAVDTPVLREPLTRLSDSQRGLVCEFFLAHAPTRQRLFRTTRRRLHEYRRQGLIRDQVPHRHVVSERIPLTPQEAAAYREIERYLARHYRNARAGGQRGLGFVLTCYRQRMSSSPHALRCSLERLWQRLTQGVARPADLLDADDLPDDAELREEDLQAVETLAFLPQDLQDLERLLAEVRSLHMDSKLRRLQTLLDELLLGYQRVIVFSQYADTMDYIRESLLARTRRVGCFSGRGAEVYDPEAGRFVPVSKEELQERFRRDGGIHLLVCTNAAAEGLNLQACGALVNYDMPWNPMRLEQRIGRIDRIGQVHPVVRVHNLFATPSVEDDVYQALEHRIGLFERFVGPLQPILAMAQRAIRDLAMSDPDERPVAQAQAVERLAHGLAELEKRAPATPVAEGFERPVPPAPVPQSPVALADLKRFWLRSPTLLGRGALRELGDGIYEIRWQGRLYPISFDPEPAERRVKGALLFTYGHPYFEDLLARAQLGDPELDAFGLRRTVAPDGRVAYWSGTRQILTLGELLQRLHAG